MTLSGVIALTFPFSVTVVEDRAMMSANIVFQLQSSTFGHNYPTLQCSLSAIAELLVRSNAVTITIIIVVIVIVVIVVVSS